MIPDINKLKKYIDEEIQINQAQADKSRDRGVYETPAELIERNHIQGKVMALLELKIFMTERGF